MDFRDVQNGCQGDIDSATMQRGSPTLHIKTTTGEYLMIDVPTVLHLASNLDIVHFAKSSANVPIHLPIKQGRYKTVTDTKDGDARTVFISSGNNEIFDSAYTAAKSVQPQRIKKRKNIQEIDAGDPLPNSSTGAKTDADEEDIVDCLITGELTREQKDEVGRANAIEL
jgi:hypothetical protein